MQPNELRIGNYVYDRGVPVDLRPSQLVNIITSKHLVYEPIPISEEWLISFGFEIIGSNYRLVVDEDDLIEFPIRTNIKKGKFYYWLSQGKIEVNYVHQLQNLYFALTGTELEYNSNQHKTLISK